MLFELGRFSIRPEHDEARQRRPQIFFYVACEAAHVERSVGGKRRGERRVDAGE
jgi:hypothetical protein